MTDSAGDEELTRCEQYGEHRRARLVDPKYTMWSCDDCGAEWWEDDDDDDNEETEVSENPENTAQPDDDTTEHKVKFDFDYTSRTYTLHVTGPLDGVEDMLHHLATVEFAEQIAEQIAGEIAVRKAEG